MNDKQKTIFIDIDGTLLEHKRILYRMITEDPIILDGVIDTLTKWRNDGHYIVLTTARASGTKMATERQLMKCGIFYDKLIMGLTNGPRVLINDVKTDGRISATAFSIPKNGGISHIEI